MNKATKKVSQEVMTPKTATTWMNVDLLVRGTSFVSKWLSNLLKRFQTKKQFSVAVAHLEEEVRNLMKKALVGDRPIIGWKLDERCPSKLQYRHAFELRDCMPIRPPIRRLPENLNKIVKVEKNMMLKANLIKYANSPRAFAVVIARKKDGSSRFCLYYRTPDKGMKTYEYSIPNIEEVLDDLEGVTVFSKLDSFASYSKVRLADHVQKQTTFRCKYGSYQFQVMLSRLINALVVFHRMA